MMKPNLMISYSRRQTPFVDRLADELEDDGYSLWLDYQCLVPARPWFQQIEAGVSGADAVLLIVSKDSLASKNVEPEWKLALECKKRLVLVIFEAVPLPDALQGCEWVDFRINHNKSLKKLKELLESPRQPVTSPAPQQGFKAPKRFWLALALSVVVLIGSIPAWWTAFLPFVLAPLPWQLYKRNYNFSRVIPALFFLPLFSGLTYSALMDKGSILFFLRGFFDAWALSGSLASWILLGLLLTPVMQRRALPEAARVRFANPLVIQVKKPRSVSFAIDSASEDGRYAEDLRRGLERYGHRLAGAHEKPEAVFVLLSAYKKDTHFDPDTQAVYPILLQAVEDIAPNLQRIQWIDFRKGIRSTRTLAQLLPEPERLLKALAVPPTGYQEIFPLPVNALQYFYLILGILGGGALLISMLSLIGLMLNGDLAVGEAGSLFVSALQGILLFGAVFYSVRGLRSRRGGTAAVYPLLVLTIFQLLLHFLNLLSVIGTAGETDENLLALVSAAAGGSSVMVLAFPLGLLITLSVLLFSWRELYRWLPRRQNQGIDKVERALLLYTPLRKGALVVHILFHATLIVALCILFLLISVKDLAMASIFIILSVLLLLGIRWVAWRVSNEGA